MSVDYSAVLGYGIIVDHETLVSLVEKEKYLTTNNFFEYLEANELSNYAISISEYYSKSEVFIGIPITANIFLDSFIEELEMVYQKFLLIWNQLFPHTRVQEMDEAEIKSFVRVW